MRVKREADRLRLRKKKQLIVSAHFSRSVSVNKLYFVCRLVAFLIFSFHQNGTNHCMYNVHMCTMITWNMNEWIWNYSICTRWKPNKVARAAAETKREGERKSERTIISKVQQKIYEWNFAEFPLRCSAHETSTTINMNDHRATI